MLVNPKETTYTVIFTTFATKNVKKIPKNWKNRSYELPTELPLFLEKILPCSMFHVQSVAAQCSKMCEKVESTICLKSL